MTTMEELTAHPLFVPASLILGALVLFAIVLYANSPKKRPRKNLQLAEAQRITADVAPTQYIAIGDGKEVRRSSRVSKPPAPFADYMTPSKTPRVKVKAEPDSSSPVVTPKTARVTRSAKSPATEKPAKPAVVASPPARKARTPRV